jgi:hypothetical protein
MAASIRARYLQVYYLRIYDKACHEIMVHHGFEYCGLIAHHSSSRLGNSMSPALYGLAQPSVRYAATWVLTLVDDQGLEPNRIQLSYLDGAMHRKPFTATNDKNA